MTATTLWIIAAGAVATYLTRIGGYLIVSRFTLNPRIEAALNAVPAAVLTTLVAPSMLNAGAYEWAALVTSGLASLYGGMVSVFFAGAIVLILLRNLAA